MARNRGNLMRCVRLTLHHVSPANVRAVELQLKMDPTRVEELVTYRFELIRDELETAMRQLERIEKIARERGFMEITDVIDEEVEFGHDF